MKKTISIAGIMLIALLMSIMPVYADREKKEDAIDGFNFYYAINNGFVVSEVSVCMTPDKKQAYATTNVKSDNLLGKAESIAKNLLRNTSKDKILKLSRHFACVNVYI